MQNSCVLTYESTEDTVKICIPGDSKHRHTRKGWLMIWAAKVLLESRLLMITFRHAGLIRVRILGQLLKGLGLDKALPAYTQMQTCLTCTTYASTLRDYPSHFKKY